MIYFGQCCVFEPWWQVRTILTRSDNADMSADMVVVVQKKGSGPTQLPSAGNKMDKKKKKIKVKSFDAKLCSEIIFCLMLQIVKNLFEY